MGVQGAVNGSVALVGGNVVFIAGGNHNGPARSPATAADGNGGTSTATVTVNVAAVNDAPVAQAANFTVAEDAAVVNGASHGHRCGRWQHAELCAQRRVARQGLIVHQQTAATASTPGTLRTSPGGASPPSSP